jgi:SAM-dependent methyltransferase
MPEQFAPLSKMSEAESLIPPDALLFDGTGSRQAFIDGGPGFLWNSLVARARLEPQHAVLDIGSGNGKHARVLVDFLSDRGSYCGFDIVPAGVTWCQERYARFVNFRFDLADIRSDWYNPAGAESAESYVFPYRDATFDVAFAASLFTHIQPLQTRNYLGQAARVLKPGGRLLMTCFLVNEHNGGRHARQVQGREFVRASGEHFVIDVDSPSRGVAYEESTLRSMVREAGLVVAELTFGTWANDVDTLGAFQDALVAIKPWTTALPVIDSGGGDRSRRSD